MVTIQNECGLHARPASELAKECKRYQSQIELHCQNRASNAKSVISLLGGGFRKGDRVEVRVTGVDEHLAGPAIADFIEALKD